MVKTYRPQLNSFTLYGNLTSHSDFLLHVFLTVYTEILLNFENTVTFLLIISQRPVFIPDAAHS